MEIKNTAKESALIGVDGRPRFGLYSSPLTSLRLEDFRPHGSKDRASLTRRWILKYRIKRWEYLGIGNDHLLFGIAVVRLGYMCNLFAYLFDRRNGRIREYNILTPGGGAAIFQGTSLTGEIHFKNPKTTVRLTSDPETVTVEGIVKGELSLNLSFQKSEEPLVCLTRVGLKGFNYTHKEAGIPVLGTIGLKGVSWDIQENCSFGVRDYTLGYLARQTFWNWASGGGLDRQGNRLGFNLVQGVNETGFTENGFWVNGRLVKTDVVHEISSTQQWFWFSASGLVSRQVAQHSVHPTCGSLRHFQAFSWLRFYTALRANPRPPTRG
ncbi:MAG: DUF2804 domain-containing protein [Deltaproteobacteria bacterium]|nr:DUF2804 domain-containing protein [Deltaproteobacteria bacterium]